MKYLLGLSFILPVHAAHAGVNLTEEEYLELATIVVQATVSESNCLSSAEDSDSIQTKYEATLTISSIIKDNPAQALGDEITLASTVIEYKGDQPSCGANGVVHPEGEAGTYYLVESGTPGVYRDVDQFSTVDAENSAPEADPVCDSDDIESSNGCSIAATPATPWMLSMAMLFLGLATRRK